jgi:hypothetical protein
MSGGIDRNGGAVEQRFLGGMPGGIEGETGAGVAEHLGGGRSARIPQGVREVERLALGGSDRHVGCLEESDVFTLPFRRRIAAWAGLL